MTSDAKALRPHSLGCWFQILKVTIVDVFQEHGFEM